jgi:prepilin-type N-terminal cleavage/methylation domain-containing protein
MAMFLNRKKILKRIFNRNGFTLIEILVAITLSSIIIFMIYAVHTSVIKSIHKLTGVADFYENLNLSIRKIDRDISCLY